ncbi:MAG: HAD family phosphatase [Betaproteobacteria bacterium]|nr:MAG: HAD family phosphatase [Betaproteobacteria bacterium]
MTDDIRVLLFDLGGVILEIDFNRVFEVWGAHAGVPAPVIRSRFRFDAFYESHERGQITASAYFESLRASLGIRLSDAQFTEGWNAIFTGEVPGIAALLRQSKEILPLYVFSNTNSMHHAYWAREFADTMRNFQKVFVSSDLGRRKPEPEAFAAVTSAIGVPFENILFFDDTDENVQSARSLGMHAVHVGALADIENALGKIQIPSYRRTPVSSKRR